MSRRPPLTVAAVAVLVVLAGCNVSFSSGSTASSEEPTAEPTPTATTTATPTDDTPSPPDTPSSTRTDQSTGPAPTSTPVPTERPSTDTSGDGPETVVGESARVAVEGDLPVNATVVYRRVERLLNVSAPAPRVVFRESNQVVSQSRTEPVQHALGFRNETSALRQCGVFGNGYAASDAVYVVSVNLSATGIEFVLVHEYAHFLQRELDGYDAGLRDPSSQLDIALREGSAVYVEETYAERYDKRMGGERPLEVRECFYRHSVLVPSYFGARYLDQRLDSPAALSTVYTDPPGTMEQVIHGETPASEPPAPLSVTKGDSWQSSDSARGGELLVRAWLSIGLDEARVDTAATGWGNGTVLTASGRDGRVVGWVLRWDSPTDADEFASAVGALEPTLESRKWTEVRLVRVSDETVVVFAGHASAVANATASGTTGNVTVSSS